MWTHSGLYLLHCNHSQENNENHDFLGNLKGEEKPEIAMRKMQCWETMLYINVIFLSYYHQVNLKPLSQKIYKKMKKGENLGCIHKIFIEVDYLLMDLLKALRNKCLFFYDR